MVSQIQFKEEWDQYCKENRFRVFNPNGKQEEVINAAASGDNFIVILSAGNGVGKTALMANILGSIIFDNSKNPFFDKPFFNNFPHPKRARIASSTKNVEEIGAIQTEIKTWWPKGKYETSKRGKTYDSEYVAGDWVLDIMTYSQEVTEYESATLGVVMFDEPPPLKILNASIARMRKGGIIMIFMTPLDTGGEIIEDLTEKGEIEVEGEKLGNVKIIYADIEDNCKQHGIRGQLDHEHIAQMLSFYDPEEIEARARGKPSHLIGRIYPTFAVGEPFVCDDFDIPEHWFRIQVLDPHDAIPFAVTWAAMDEVNDIWIYNEFPFQDLDKIKSTNFTLVDYSRIFRESEGRDIVGLRLIDPYFANHRYSKDGKTLKEELGDIGFEYEDGSTEGVETGHKKVREYLRFDTRLPISTLNHPKLHVLKKCRNHWRSLYRYKKKFPKSGEVKDKIIIEETYKHFCDNIRHLIMRSDLRDLRRFQNNVDFSGGIGGDRGGY